MRPHYLLRGCVLYLFSVLCAEAHGGVLCDDVSEFHDLSAGNRDSNDDSDMAQRGAQRHYP